LFITRCRAYRHLAIDSMEQTAPRHRKETEMAPVQGADQHHETVDVTTNERPKVLMVVANPTTFSLDEVAAAFVRVAERGQRGKVVLSVTDN
jgi:hypothetical protein